MSKKQPTYTEEFKQQIVSLYRSGKSRSDIAREYCISKTSVNNWIKYFENSGSFKIKDNRSEEDNELIRLRKENKQLLMENDIF